MCVCVCLHVIVCVHVYEVGTIAYLNGRFNSQTGSLWSVVWLVVPCTTVP